MSAKTKSAQKANTAETAEADISKKVTEFKPAADQAGASAPVDKPKSKWKRRVLMVVVPLLLLVGGGTYWLLGGRYVTTENAYAHQPMIAVSADVNGRIVDVMVHENQLVKTGQPLFRIDPEPYQIALDQADAALAQARLSVAQLRAAHATAQAQLDAAKGILALRERENKRQKELTGRGVGTAAQLDESDVAVRAARNNVALAERRLEAAVAALGGNPDGDADKMPSVRAALAARDAAKRNLEKTLVKAPSAGQISQLGALNVGQVVSLGAQVATLVDKGDTWVEANLKETQLATVKVGQPVTVSVDAYPDRELHGTVQSFGSATGSQFSLIPAQNATGNWVKVVQRVSIRIKLDGQQTQGLLSGMSAHVSIDTGKSHLDELL
ncbi:HlyD family secretion protein [Aquicoccus sp. G2-2]|uniref:HlyD family secretion protein n=1 Tax=Aquicoccus sp. G2-2 TaxID=3092120 RepID=UPI002ADFB550|nr:HlyD family secretion protein [Aquicoccus sp. G2-2]MEA1114047.1 HlyD family secretion protein [Aquicoccus sp. G2-2]